MAAPQTRRPVCGQSTCEHERGCWDDAHRRWESGVCKPSCGSCRIVASEIRRIEFRSFRHPGTTPLYHHDTPKWLPRLDAWLALHILRKRQRSLFLPYFLSERRRLSGRLMQVPILSFARLHCVSERVQLLQVRLAY